MHYLVNSQQPPYRIDAPVSSIFPVVANLPQVTQLLSGRSRLQSHQVAFRVLALNHNASPAPKDIKIYTVGENSIKRGLERTMFVQDFIGFKESSFFFFFLFCKMFLYLAAWGLGCGVPGLHCIVRDLSLSRTASLVCHVGSVVHGLSCSKACGIFVP